MKKVVKNFLRGFSFYRFVIPHKYKLKEKNAQSMLSIDVIKIQQDIDNVNGKIKGNICQK